VMVRKKNTRCKPDFIFFKSVNKPMPSTIKLAVAEIAGLLEGNVFKKGINSIDI